MKHLSCLLFCSIIHSFSFSQEEFSFELYFEDALGNRDTLVLGYDLNGSQGLDNQFGEEDISQTPWDTSFEVRASNNVSPNPTTSSPPVYFTKKQIIEKDCDIYDAQNSPWEGMIFNVLINIHSDSFPVTVYWDPLVFNDSCNLGSTLYRGEVFSSWEWGCCPTFMSSHIDHDYITQPIADSLVLENASLNSYELNGMEIYNYRLSFSHYYQVPLVGLQENNKTQLKVYPNPVINTLTIDLGEIVKKKRTIEIYDILGSQVYSKEIDGNGNLNINIEHFKRGLYFIHLKTQYEEQIVQKIIKY